MKKLTNAESMVMKTIWRQQQELGLHAIMILTNETYGKAWKPQTVSTYIAKLVNKEFIRMKNSGRKAVYEVVIPEAAYRKYENNKFVEFWNNGSAVEFLRTYYEDREISEEEITGLRKYVEELAEVRGSSTRN